MHSNFQGYWKTNCYSIPVKGIATRIPFAMRNKALNDDNDDDDDDNDDNNNNSDPVVSKVTKWKTQKRLNKITSDSMKDVSIIPATLANSNNLI